MAGAIHILAVDDDSVACELLREVLEQEGYQVSTATTGQVAIDLAREVPFDLAIIDIRMPDISGIEVLKALKRANAQMPVLMTTAYSSMNTAIEAIREGAYDYLSKPCKMEELTLTVDRALEQSKLLRENQYFRQELREKYKFENIVGTTPAMLAVYKTVARLVDSKATVLIQGESGSGKELIARAIHFNGPRAERALSPSNAPPWPKHFSKASCLAMSGSICRSSGHQKGSSKSPMAGRSFSMRSPKSAWGFRPSCCVCCRNRRSVGLGDPTDSARCAGHCRTNKDAEALVKAERFREDLFYRLNVVAPSSTPARAPGRHPLAG